MKWICNKKTAEIGKSLAAIGLALVIGALFILLAGESPIRAYTSLIQGALGTPQSIANTISKSIPLAFTGLAAVSYTHLDVYKRQPILTGKRAVHWGYGKAGLKLSLIHI